MRVEALTRSANIRKSILSLKRFLYVSFQQAAVIPDTFVAIVIYKETPNLLTMNCALSLTDVFGTSIKS